MAKSTTLPTQWPTFRGSPLTAREIDSGRIITRLFVPKSRGGFGSNWNSHDQLWIGRGGTIFFELRYGLPPFETSDGKSVLTDLGAHRLNEEVRQVHGHVAEGRAVFQQPTGNSFTVVFERKVFPPLKI